MSKKTFLGPFVLSLGALVLLPLLFFCGIAISQDISLSAQEIARIADKVFENECSSKDEYLVQWNKGEDFLSLGIGHFIWYSKNQRGPFDESFVKYLSFARASGEKMPDWLDADQFQDCPWNSREDFLSDPESGKLIELKEFLVATKPLQATFIIERLKSALPLVLQNASADKRDDISRQFNRIASTPAGLYALADYVNFKGLGILASERYNGEGWGLLQILSEMEGYANDVQAVEEFAQVAKRILVRRIANSPQGRNEQKWLLGWKRRVDSYTE